MSIRFIIIALLGLASSSCEKARSLAGQAKSAMENQINKTPVESADTPPDPELQKLVDQTAEGVIFRKDLPFPVRFEIKTTLNQEFSGRISTTSAIEKQVKTLKGNQTTALKFERAGDQIRYTMEKSTFTESVPDEADDSKKQVKELAPPSKPQVYHKVGSTWKSENSEGFRAVALSKQLSPVFDLLLVENALAPRSLWFAKTRIKIGDRLTVTDKTLPMLLAGNAKGSFTLTLQSIGSVRGHPCGVFAFTGDYSRKQMPDFEGELTDEDVTIQSGKLWLSLIYPLVLREEAETIQTIRRGDGVNAGGRSQGLVKVSLLRDWKKL